MVIVTTSFSVGNSIENLPSTRAYQISQRFSPSNLVQALDRGDVADAVRQVEVGWKKQYEDYFQGQLTVKLLQSDSESVGKHRSPNRSEICTALQHSNRQSFRTDPSDRKCSTIHRRITEARQTVLLKVIEDLGVGVFNPITDSVEYLPPAQQFYRWLVSLLDSSLRSQRIDTLIFCLGADPRSLPVAALDNGKRFFVEKYHLALISAFNLLDVQRGNFTQSRVLAIGASQFQQLNPLPAVPLELSAITTNLWLGKTFLNQSFTIDTLKNQRSLYPFEVIHLATHAEFSPGDIDQLFMQFWDRSLHLGQIRELELRSPPVQLLILSACRTALGDTQAELGFAVVVMSGAKAALASLWLVSAGTLILMSEFYRQLKTPLKSEALRRTQIAMLPGKLRLRTSQALRSLRVARKGSRSIHLLPPDLAKFHDQDLSHPYYWSAFTMSSHCCSFE